MNAKQFFPCPMCDAAYGDVIQASECCEPRCVWTCDRCHRDYDTKEEAGECCQ